MTMISTAQNAGMARIVERQMRNWELARKQTSSGPAGPPHQVEHFVALSRAVGLAGAEIASLLNVKLGWPVFDRAILQAMAGDDESRRNLYAVMDERDLGWLQAYLNSICLRGGGRDDYFHRLSETVLSLARKGHAIFVGRAADLILPRQAGLRVRITATREFCIEQHARSGGIPFEAAAREVEQIEEERARFIRNHFRVEAGEPTRHDLILNMAHFTAPQAAELIIAAMRLRGMIG